MNKVAIIHNPSNNHARAWKSWLESSNFKVDAVHDNISFDRSKNIKYNLIIPLITISDYTNKNNIRMKALLHFESKGLRLLTPFGAIAASSDKLETANILDNNSLPHPTTELSSDFNWAKGHEPIILKPRFGHSGNGIYLIKNEEAFNKHRGDDVLAQRFIKDAECIRIIASQTEILSSYKKIPPKGEIIANIEKGARRLPLILDDRMGKLAISAVRALGGGLMGVDLLDSRSGLFILEANVPFGFDTSNQELQEKLVSYIEKQVR